MEKLDEQTLSQQQIIMLNIWKRKPNIYKQTGVLISVLMSIDRPSFLEASCQLCKHQLFSQKFNCWL